MTISKSTKAKIAVLVALGGMALAQIACSDTDNKIMSGTQNAVSGIQSGVTTLSNSCLAGLATGDTGKMVNGACGQ